MASKSSSGASNKKLPYNKSIPLGIQHVLAMFAGNITVPIIIAAPNILLPESTPFNVKGRILLLKTFKNLSNRISVIYLKHQIKTIIVNIIKLNNVFYRSNNTT